MKTQELIKISDEAILGFAKEWRLFPYRWLQEIDVQFELIQRFRNILKRKNEKLFFSAKHDHEPNKDNEFSRLTCEPYVKLLTKSWMHPDIVMWSCEQSNIYINSGNYPIDLICEIKYSFDEINSEVDQKRLIDALQAVSRPNLAIQLILVQKSKAMIKTEERIVSFDNKLIVYKIYLKTK